MAQPSWCLYITVVYNPVIQSWNCSHVECTTCGMFQLTAMAFSSGNSFVWICLGCINDNPILLLQKEDFQGPPPPRMTAPGKRAASVISFVHWIPPLLIPRLCHPLFGFVVWRLMQKKYRRNKSFLRWGTSVYRSRSTTCHCLLIW